MIDASGATTALHVATMLAAAALLVALPLAERTRRTAALAPP